MEKKWFVVKLDNDGFEREWCLVSAYDVESLADKVRAMVSSFEKSKSFSFEEVDLKKVN